MLETHLRVPTWASAGPERGPWVLLLDTWLVSHSPTLSGGCNPFSRAVQRDQLSAPPCPCKIHGILHNGLSHPKAPALGLCGQSTGPREAEELMQTVPF